MCSSRYSERICPASNDNSEKMSDVESARRAMLELAERAKQDAGLEVKLAKSIREFYNTATGMEHPLFAQDARFCQDLSVGDDFAMSVGKEGEYVISRDSKAFFPIRFHHCEDATGVSYSVERVRVKAQQTDSGRVFELVCESGDNTSAPVTVDAIDDVLRDTDTNNAQKIFTISTKLRMDPDFRKRELKAHGPQVCAETWLHTRMHLARQLLWLSEYVS